MKNKTITTKLHSYYLNLDNKKEALEYFELCDKLRKDRKLFDCISVGISKGRLFEVGTTEIKIETKHLFSNQYNTECGKRVFDWTEEIFPNKKIKSGHWVEITQELKDLKDNTYICGHCGYQTTKQDSFCSECLGSSFLEKRDLKLLRMLPISSNLPKTAELSQEEEKTLLALYVAAQTKQGHSRNKKNIENKRKDIEEEYKKATENAEIKYKGFSWLLDNNINIDNCIYYSHTKTFSFGWRSPLSDEVKEELKNSLKGFDFKYETK